MKTKRAFLTICALSLFMGMYSQLVYDDNPHLMFNNIPMNGTLAEFTEKLVKQGFTITSKSDNSIDLDGKMFNTECKLIVTGTEKSKTVYAIEVNFKPCEISWQTLKKKYTDFKKIFQTKYGVGDSYESFKEPYKEGDGNELIALMECMCLHSTYWKSNLGEIRLSIHCNLEGESNCYLVYIDKTNGTISNNEKPSNDDEW